MGNPRFEIRHLLAQRTSVKRKVENRKRKKKTWRLGRTGLNSYRQLENLD